MEGKEKRNNKGEAEGENKRRKDENKKSDRMVTNKDVRKWWIE